MQNIYWAISIIILVPSLYKTLVWISKRTSTQKDDDLLGKVKER